MISDYDRKIILSLQENGRSSYTELAAKLGISVSTITSRTEKLINSKVIEVKAIPNPVKLGLVANAIIFVEVEPLAVEAFCDKFRDNIFVTSIFTIFGKFDIALMVSYPSWEALHKFIASQIFKAPGVCKIETFFLEEIKKRHSRFFDGKPGQTQRVELSSTDMKLIVELTKNGRMSLSELSANVDIHVSTISRKIISFTRQNIIKIIAVPNPHQFGIVSAAILVLSIEPPKIGSINKILDTFPDVVFMANMLNSSSIVIGTQTGSNEELYELIKDRISRIKGIISVDPFITAKIKKRFFGWFMQDSE